MARLRTRETKSPTWASTTSILHLSIASSQAKGKLGKNTKVLQGTKRCRLKHKFRKQWTIVSLLAILLCLQCIQRVPYIAFQWGNLNGRIRAISRHMEGLETSELDPCQGKLQKDLNFVHIPMYTVLGVKPVYIRDKGFKSRV